MTKLYAVCVLLSISLFFGCNDVSGAFEHEAGKALGEIDHDQRTALGNLLSVFDGSTGRAWSSYRYAEGISWSASAPNEYAKGRFELSGRMILLGFGPTKLPNGKLGSDYVEIDGNEGQSGVTLDGTKNSVTGFSVKKFYYSEDYQKILALQLPLSSVEKIAFRCLSDKESEVSEKREFFRVERTKNEVAYVEAWLEAGGKYSPGYTVFDFSHDRPAARISQLRCALG
jgi:hypothetical protein